MGIAIVALVVLLCTGGVTKAQPLTFNAKLVGGPFSNAIAELYTPSGAGPFGAVVVLHGCNGVGPNYRSWARQLAEWG